MCPQCTVKVPNLEHWTLIGTPQKITMIACTRLIWIFLFSWKHHHWNIQCCFLLHLHFSLYLWLQDTTWTDIDLRSWELVIPCSGLFNCAILSQEKKGHLSKIDTEYMTHDAFLPMFFWFYLFCSQKIT